MKQWMYRTMSATSWIVVLGGVLGLLALWVAPNAVEPAQASTVQQYGALKVTAWGDTEGHPLEFIQLSLRRNGVEVAGGGTGPDGTYTFTHLEVGSYELTAYRDAWAYKNVTVQVAVGPAPPVTEVTVVMVRYEPDPTVEIIEPQGTIGNTEEVVIHMTASIDTMQPRVILIEVYEPENDEPVQTLADAEATFWIPDYHGELIDEYIDEDTGKLIWIYEYRFPWDTTVLYNDTHRLKVQVLYYKPFVPGDTLRVVEQTNDVRNVMLHNLAADSGNPDYFRYDPDEEGSCHEPDVSFTIVDEGQIADQLGNPYHYDWEFFVRDTRSTSWGSSNYYVATGTANAPGVVAFNIVGGLPDKGTYTFDVHVVERETGDEYWAKYPYHLSVPTSVPGTQEPGHRAYFASDDDGELCLMADYYLNGHNEPPGRVWADVIDPDLEVVAHTENLPTALATHHTQQVVHTFSNHVAKMGTYIVVLMAKDTHGDDTWQTTWGHRRLYREHENKRMLAVNDRPPYWIDSVT